MTGGSRNQGGSPPQQQRQYGENWKSGYRDEQPEQGAQSRTPVARAMKELGFTLDHYSEEDQFHYRGNFVVQRPNVLQKAEIEAAKISILKGHYHDPDNPGCGVPGMVQMQAEMLGYLRVVIKDAPDWWWEGELYDQNVLSEIYERSIVLDPFRRRIFAGLFEKQRELLGGSGEDSDHQHNQPDAGRVLEEMVGEDVPQPDHER